MSLSPIDVAQQQFRRVLHGYHVREVEAFLQAVAHAMTDLVRQNAELKAQLAAQEQKTLGLERRENDVKEALVLAQRAVEEVRGEADQKARLRVEQAEVEAHKILADAQGRQVSLSAQVRELTGQRTRFVEELRALVTTHARLLDMHLGEATGHAHARGDDAVGSDVFAVLQAPSPPALLDAPPPVGSRAARALRAGGRADERGRPHRVDASGQAHGE